MKKKFLHGTVGVFAFTNDHEHFETGVTSFNIDLIEKLCKKYSNLVFYIYLSPKNSKRYDKVNFKNCCKIILPANYGENHKSLKIIFLLKKIIKVLFYPYYKDYSWYFKFFKQPYHPVYIYTVFGAFQDFPAFIQDRVGAYCFTFVHDVRFIRRKEHHSVLKILLHFYAKALFKKLINSSRKVLFPTENSLILTHSVFPARNYEISYSIPTIHSSTSHKYVSDHAICFLPDNISQNKYFYFPATIIQTKNHVVLIKAFARLFKKNPDLLLVLSGSNWNSKIADGIRDLIQSLSLGKQVIHVGFVDKNTRDALYMSAIAAIFPCQDESFNLGIWEAFTLRCAVISSNDPELLEQVGEAALIATVGDEEDLAQKMELIIKDDALRHALIDAGLLRLAKLKQESLLSGWDTELPTLANSKCLN